MKTHTKLARLYNKAENKQGLIWYRDAYRFSKEVASVTGLPVRVVVGVLSALSPNNKWERNKIDLVNFLKSGGTAKVCTYNNQKEKALKILVQQPTELGIKRILRGDKTVNFFQNILHPYTDGAVTIDRWAIRAAGFSEKGLKVADYREIKQAYLLAAKKVGVRPQELQAVIWEEIRGN